MTQFHPLSNITYVVSCLILCVLCGLVFQYSIINQNSLSNNFISTILSKHDEIDVKSHNRRLQMLGSNRKNMNRGHRRHNANNNTVEHGSGKGGHGIYVLPIPDGTFDVPPPWGDIPMPTKSYFAGFNPPSDELKWKTAQLQASRGEQILLSKVLNFIKSPFDYVHGEKTFKWIHRLADFHKSEKTLLSDMTTVRGFRAPITMFGYRKFDRLGFEGNEVEGGGSFNPDEMLRNKDFVIPRKIVGIGNQVIIMKGNFLSAAGHAMTICVCVSIY